MKVINTTLSEVIIVEPRVFRDYRGWFVEAYSKKEWKEAGIVAHFVQDNHSFSLQKGTLRGLHFQNDPHAQTKLVRCTRGAILDIVVDIRKGSPTYKQWIAVELSEANYRQLYVPKGFAHGFVALSDNVEVQYKVDDYYVPSLDRSIRFDDPDLAIDWGISAPILSEKDLNAPYLKDSDCNFIYKE